jgi:hypothetical protein
VSHNHNYLYIHMLFQKNKNKIKREWDSSWPTYRWYDYIFNSYV